MPDTEDREERLAELVEAYLDLRWPITVPATQPMPQNSGICLREWWRWRA